MPFVSSGVRYHSVQYHNWEFPVDGFLSPLCTSRDAEFFIFRLTRSRCDVHFLRSMLVNHTGIISFPPRDHTRWVTPLSTTYLRVIFFTKQKINNFHNTFALLSDYFFLYFITIYTYISLKV